MRGQKKRTEEELTEGGLVSAAKVTRRLLLPSLIAPQDTQTGSGIGPNPRGQEGRGQEDRFAVRRYPWERERESGGVGERGGEGGRDRGARHNRGEGQTPGEGRRSCSGDREKLSADLLYANNSPIRPSTKKYYFIPPQIHSGL